MTIKRNTKKIVIATRGSKLAMWQANWIKTELEKKHPGIEVELKKIKTTGDKILDVPLAKVGGKGLFVKEIEEALLRGDADLAVHSMKDVPADLPAELHIKAICKRENPRDALITRVHSYQFTVHSFNDLPQGTKIGTSSLRRSCQLLNIRPDLKIAQLRGNLDTRIRKLDEGQFDAIIVAAAGVKRLGMADRITEILETDVSLPAIGQGAVGIECRKEDRLISNLLEPLNHPATSVCVRAERAFLKKLEGGCQVPIAGYAQLLQQGSGARGQGSDCELSTDNCQLVIDGLVGSVSGDTIIRDSIRGNVDNAEQLGTKLAEELLSKGAGEILAEVYNQR
ncbi:MAG: hydroxymethylbilane synthase [Thermodesulfovibrionia bacterium]